MASTVLQHQPTLPARSRSYTLTAQSRELPLRDVASKRLRERCMRSFRTIESRQLRRRSNNAFERPGTRATSARGQRAIHFAPSARLRALRPAAQREREPLVYARGLGPEPTGTRDAEIRNNLRRISDDIVRKCGNG